MKTIKLLLFASLLFLVGCTTKREIIRATEIKIIKVPAHYSAPVEKTKLYYPLNKEFKEADSIFKITTYPYNHVSESKY